MQVKFIFEIGFIILLNLFWVGYVSSFRNKKWMIHKRVEVNVLWARYIRRGVMNICADMPTELDFFNKIFNK